jgi:hypothetical protein
MAYGTLTVGDLLANQATIAQIGEDRVWESIDSALRIHNGFVQEGLRDLVTPTTDQQKRFGGPDTMTMDDLDEMGSPDAQKVTAGTNVGFPLYLKGVAVQWTRTYFKNATGQEFAEQFVAAQDADVRKIFTDIKRAMYYPTNKTVVDKLVSNAISLSVKALTNADSTAVPLAPDGTSFNAATHTHYLYTAGTSPGRCGRDGRDQHRRRALQRRQGAGLHQLGAGDRDAGADRLHRRSRPCRSSRR